jgi:hypothetical protein
MPRPQSLRHLSGSIPALGTDGVHGPRGHFSPGRRVWWNYARLFIPMLVGQAAVVGHEQPAIPGLTQIEARPAVRAATEVCRPWRRRAGTHVSMQSRNGADRSTFMCTPDAWDAPPPYSLGQWCQRPLKRTLKQEPGRDARARLRATSMVFRQRIRLEW